MQGLTSDILTTTMLARAASKALRNRLRTTCVGMTRTTVVADCGASRDSLRSTASVGSVAQYFSVPEPSWNVDHINALKTGSRGRNRRTVKLGHRLTPAESRALNLAKRHGYLVMKGQCGQSVCNKYLHFCYEDQRPYIAMNMHGDRLVVDLAPVEGLGGFKDASRMDDMEDLFSEVLEGHWIKHFQIVNAVSEDQMAERVQAAAADNLDGSNDHKANDDDITSQFHILTRKRQESMVIARDLVKAMTEVDESRKSAKQLALEREEKRLQKLYRSQKMMRAKLRELIADKKAFSHLPKGALDGFIKYDAEKRPHLKWYPAKWINKPC